MAMRIQPSRVHALSGTNSFHEVFQTGFIKLYEYDLSRQVSQKLFDNFLEFVRLVHVG